MFRFSLLPCLIAITVFSGFLTANPEPSFAADRSSPPAAIDQSDIESNPNIETGQHVEGHIAFLHAELAITPAQEDLWQPVAAAMRQDVKEMRDAENKVMRQDHNHETAVQYLQNRVMFANLRAAGEERFLTAMQPLYNNLSPQQKKNADSLLTSTEASNP